MVVTLSLLFSGCAVEEKVEPPPVNHPEEAEEEEVDLGGPDPVAQLFRASLDLRGVRPTIEEIDRVHADPDLYSEMVQGFLDDDRFVDDLDFGDALMRNPRVQGVNADRNVVDALENAWDPLLIASLHNDQMPVNSSSRSASELKQAYHAQFPQTWKNLLTTQDIAFARKQVVKQAKSLN